MRTRGRTDKNQQEVVAALRKAGATVQSLANIGNGCPDLLVGFNGKNLLMEVKDGMAPPSKRRLTDDEKAWHISWGSRVYVVESVPDVLAVLGLLQEGK